MVEWRAAKTTTVETPQLGPSHLLVTAGNVLALVREARQGLARLRKPIAVLVQADVESYRSLLVTAANGLYTVKQHKQAAYMKELAHVAG